MQVVLVIFRADGERRSFSIARDITVVGRREDCDLRIPLGDVSRKHCRIIKSDDQVRIEDLGSSNGTFHNGERIQEAYLSPGDHVQIGPVVFVVQIDGVPAEEELVPATDDAQGTSVGAAGFAEAETPVEEVVAEGEPTEAVVEAEVVEDAPPVDESALEIVSDTPATEGDLDDIQIVMDESERADEPQKSR